MRIASISEQQYILVSNNQTISFISIKSRSQALEIKVPMGMISEIAISNQHNKVAYSDTFGKIRVVELKREKHSSTLQIVNTQTLLWHAHSVKVLKFNSINYLYSGGQEGVIVLWQLLQGEKNFIAHLGYKVFDLCISHDNSQIAVTLENNKMFVLDSQNFKPSLLTQTIAPLNKTTPSKLRITKDIRTGCLLVPQIGGWLQFVDLNSSQSVVSKVFDINISGRNYVSKLQHSDPDPLVEIKNFCLVGQNLLMTLEEIKLDSKFQKVKIWKKITKSEFQLLSTFSNSISSFFQQEIQALISPEQAKTPHFLQIKETQFNIWTSSPQDERQWTSQNYGEFRKKKITSFQYSECCKGGNEGLEFLLIAFETAITTWNLFYLEDGRVSYSLSSSFSFSKLHGQVLEISLSLNNRYLCVRKAAGVINVYRYQSMEMLWELPISDTVLFLKGGQNSFGLLDSPNNNLMIFDYTSKVPIQSKTIKRKQPTQADDALVLAGFYENNKILLIYESGGMVKVLKKEELLNGAKRKEEEFKEKQSNQPSLSKKLRSVFRAKIQEQEEKLDEQGKERIFIKNMRNKLGLKHMSAKFKKGRIQEEQRKFYQSQGDIAENFEKYLRMTDPTIYQMERGNLAQNQQEDEFKTEDRKQKEEEQQLKRVGEFPKIEELRAMIKRDASDLV